MSQLSYPVVRPLEGGVLPTSPPSKPSSLPTSTKTARLGDSATLPYWQVNVAPENRSAECPPFLLHINEKDLEILKTPDADYELLSWPELQEHIRHNRLDIFQRTPSDLRRYMAFNHEIKLQYGSIMDFVLGQKLQWQSPVVAEGAPFENERDLKVMWNDWPYGVDPRIVHLVVWTKFAFEDDAVTGDLTDRQRMQIDRYVEREFRVRCGAHNVIWFRNWAALKSVHAVEHFHVMLFDPDPKFLDEITGGGVPLFKARELGGTL